MTSTTVILAALSALAAVAYAPMPNMMSGGMYPPMMPMAHMHGRHKERQYLTCQINFRSTKNPAVILNSIAVTIKERAPDASSMMGGMMGKQSANHGPGLEATIGVFSSTGGAIKVAVTETARPQEGCKAEDFGHFLRPKNSMSGSMMSPMMGGKMMYPAMGGMMGMGYKSSSYKSSSYSPFGMHKTMGSSNYPTMGGMGMMGGYPMMGGMGMMGGMMPMMHHTHHEMDHEGVLASHTLAPGVKASINIDRLRGFTSLKELAGRGIVVCPKEKVDQDGHEAECEGMILSCCALHYSKDEVMLGGGSGTNGGGPGPAMAMSYRKISK